MADIRTLKLNLLADTANFRKGLNGARKASDTFAGRVGLSLNKATIAFAAVTGAAYGLVRVGQQLVDAAAEDAASQAKLRKSLQNTTNATDAQIKSVEKYISTQQRATGFSDTQLRASLARLTNSTKDVTKAQDLLRLAMDTSRGTGKDLETVTQAIGKAYDGNLGALKRLGVPLDANIVKTKDSAAALKTLADLYQGQASVYAETFAGKIAILNESMGELRESFGAKIIDKLNGILPYIQRVIDVLAGNADTSLSNKVKALRDGLDGRGKGGADNLAYSLQAVAESFSKLIKALTGDDAGDANAQLNNIANAFQRLANGINAIADAYARLDRFTKSKGYQKFLDIVFGPKVITPPLPTSKRAIGGPVSANMPYLVGERGPEIFTPNGSGGGRITPSGAMGGVTIIMNGIVDGESARRSIERVIQQSSRRSGAVNWSPVLT